MSALNSYRSTVNSGSNTSGTLGMSAGSTTVAPSRLRSAMAASATASASGLVRPWLGAIGTTPERVVSPRVGLIPTRALWDDGQTIAPSVSVPREAAARLAAMEVPDPLLEPHGLWSRTEGLRHWPARPDQPLEDWVERKLAHSDRLALPRMTAPARRSRRITNASRGTS